MTANENSKNLLYTLIPLDEFKSLLGVDDRDDKIARFCLITATFSIEQYCKRRLLRKKYFEWIEFYGDLMLPLKEYPVKKMLAVYVIQGTREWGTGNREEILEPEFYRIVPECGTDIDIPYSIEFSPAVARMGCKAVKAVYWAGYAIGNGEWGIGSGERKKNTVPSDLQAACLELASWNFNRYRGRHIGVTGNVRGSGKEGTHFEMSMPENVRLLLEPYRRKVI